MTDLAGEARRPVTPPVAEPHSGGSIWALTLGSVGVVYGDIGTSPLYAFRVAVVAAAESGPVTRDTVLGVLSMIVWALVDRGHDQIRAGAAALRQQRRGRHAVAHRARHARARPAIVPAAARHHRRGDVPRQLGHHAGHFGAVGGRGPGARDAGASALRPAAHHRHPDRPVRRAAPRHRAGRGLLRPGHAGLVRRHRHRRRDASARRSRGVCRDQSALRHQLRVDARPHRPDHARRGVPCRHRRRGALCRSRPFRPETHPARLARARAAGAADQLFRPGRAGAGASSGDREPVLSPGPGIAAAAARRAGHRRHRDRQPGRHHRRLFAGAAGDPAWPPAAARHRAHLGGIFRTDLSAARQHRAADRRDAAGRAVPHIERARFGLWHRGRHHHGGRRHPRIHRHLEAVAMAGLEGGAADGAAGDCGRDVLLRQSAQAPGGRLGAAVVRHLRW